MLRAVIRRLIRYAAKLPGGAWLLYYITTGTSGPIRDGVGKGLRFNPYRSSGAYLSGRNELPVQETLAEHLKRGDVFYDIGANVGFFSIIASRLVGADGAVYAFEPLPINVACLRRNVRANNLSNITVIPKAVAATSGPVEIHLTAHPGGATLVSAGYPTDAYATTRVESAFIDELLDYNQIAPPDVVKIDVEGAEVDVLRGMARALEKYHPVVIYEIDDTDPERLAHKRETCAGILQGFGYSIRLLDNAYDHTVEHYVAVVALA